MKISFKIVAPISKNSTFQVIGSFWLKDSTFVLFIIWGKEWTNWQQHLINASPEKLNWLK